MGVPFLDGDGMTMTTQLSDAERIPVDPNTASRSIYLNKTPLGKEKAPQTITVTIEW
jgi:hypothetical protein